MSEEEPVQPSQRGQALEAPPPPYSSIAAANAAFFECKEGGGRCLHPPDSLVTTLPSYDETERSEEEASVHLVAGRVMEDDFVARDDLDDADQLRIGNHGNLMLTFFIRHQSIWSHLRLWSVPH